MYYKSHWRKVALRQSTLAKLMFRSKKINVKDTSFPAMKLNRWHQNMTNVLLLIKQRRTQNSWKHYSVSITLPAQNSNNFVDRTTATTGATCGNNRRGGPQRIQSISSAATELSYAAVSNSQGAAKQTLIRVLCCTYSVLIRSCPSWCTIKKVLLGEIKTSREETSWIYFYLGLARVHACKAWRPVVATFAKKRCADFY